MEPCPNTKWEMDTFFPKALARQSLAAFKPYPPKIELCATKRTMPAGNHRSNADMNTMKNEFMRSVVIVAGGSLR